MRLDVAGHQYGGLRLRHSLPKPHRHWPLYSTRKIGKASPEEAMGASGLIPALSLSDPTLSPDPCAVVGLPLGRDAWATS